MKSCFLLTVLLGILFSPGGAQAQMSGTPHDLGKHICVYCHLPHITETPETPAWNRGVEANGGFSMYGSPQVTLATEGDPRSISLVCLSCHDGVTSSNTVLKGNGKEAQRLNSHGMFRTHPISIIYNRSQSMDFHRPEALNVNGLPLYEAENAEAGYGQMECTSCHNPHDTTYGRYLRMKNERSALCRSCHAI